MVKKSLVSTSIKYGLAGGILIILPFLVLLKMDLKPLINLNTLILEGMLMFIFIYFGLREYRDKRNQGILKFWEGMTMGFMMYLIMALISAIFISSFVYLIDPDYILTISQTNMKFVEHNTVNPDPNFNSVTSFISKAAEYDVRLYKQGEEQLIWRASLSSKLDKLEKEGRKSAQVLLTQLEQDGLI